MMALGTLFSALFSFGGLAAGWILDVPVGAMVVVIAGGVFLGTALTRMLVTYSRRRTLHHDKG
ncbi:MAG TPA: metal ABC transporter permease, partial [Sphaerochaeta sp.]|nr:metal ABC transporter permease [Sphaerochaeta sp.]